MGKLSIIEGMGSGELEDLTMQELSLEETIEALMSGSVILMTTYDNRREKDTLVRIKDTNSGKVTQISKPTTSMDGFVGNKKYWSMYDISLNSLSMYPTYVFDPTRYDIGYKYEPNSVVEYTSSYGDMDVAMVTKVLRDLDGNFHYKLSGEGDKTFREDELKTLK